MEKRFFTNTEVEKVIATAKRLFNRHIVDDKDLTENEKNEISTTFNTFLDKYVNVEEMSGATLLEKYNDFKKQFKSYLINFGSLKDIDQILHYMRLALLMSYEF